MILKIFAVLALSTGIAVELGSGAAARGLAGNLGAAAAVALWALAQFTKNEEKGR
jgi:hypothetical protein